jgi:YCII-related domain
MQETAMKKFLVLYRSNTSTSERMAKATPEQNQAVMAAWRAWAQRAAGSIVELGAPLAAPTVLKGSAAPGFVGGFSIVQADSAEAAKSIFDGHPHFENPGNSLELLEHLAISSS